MRALLSSLTVALGLGAGLAQAECGIDVPACEVPLGEYRVALPEGDGPYPAVLFLHGYGSSAEGALRMSGTMVDRGYAMIAPQGLRRSGDTGPTSWSFRPNGRKVRDEATFLRQIIADAATEHDIDPENILLTGYSIGGSTTSYLACDNPDLARAYAPLAGAFWRPHPALDACTGPVHLHHTHGWVDGTVPLEGRPLGGGAILQGDVFYSMQVWREVNGCRGLRPDRFEVGEVFWRRMWETCDNGSLEFALHAGGHGIPRGWSDMVLDWFEALPEPAALR